MAAKNTDHPRLIGGRYQVVAPLGSGSMAAVYHALDAVSGDGVAVKLMHRRASRVPTMLARFGREMRAAKTVRHPNVVRGLGNGNHQGQPFLVLELVTGSSLAKLLIEHGAMDTDTMVLLSLHAARGLEALHQHGAVHRDVKPQNMLVMMQPDGEPYALKVADLGLVCNAEEGPSITQTGVRLGTSNFMAPEQVLTEPVDGRTDVYGLGMVMFAMLTAHLPFVDKQPARVLAHQVLSAVPPPSWFAPDVDDTLDKVVQTALRKDPNLRYPSMTELRLDLERLVGTRGDEITARSFMQREDVYPVSSLAGRVALAAMRRDLGR